VSGWLGLEGRVCVVTGAASGIGRETALRLAAQGARIVAIDRDAGGSAGAAAAVRSRGGDALALACDVADPASVAAAAGKTLAAFGRCDVLVNNAGILRPGNVEALNLADWEALLRVNLTGCFLCAQAFGRDMLERGAGALVHVASIAASHPQGFSGAYSTSKAAVAMLSRQLAFEWGPSGVRSNVVSPGLVRTPLSEAFYEAPGVAEQRAAVVPARRIAAPGDIADVVAFLASDRAGYVTGHMSHVPRPGYA
jgi:NAD(P)-dependent dehydrogenase (short-subunit alcohol dehydrogenase family)